MTMESRSSSIDSSRTGTFSVRPSSMHVDILYGHTVSPIIEGTLYLSDQQAPLDYDVLNFLGVTHIVNASNEAVPNKFPESFQYCNVNVNDDNSDDLFPYFDCVCDFLSNDPAPPVDTVLTRIESSIKPNDLPGIADVIASDAVNAAILNIEKTLDNPKMPVTASIADSDQISVRDVSTCSTIPRYTKYEDTAEDRDTIAMSASSLHAQDILAPEKVILFHCWMGVSRSSSLLVAFLMKNLGMSLKDAYSLVKRKRPKVQPTPIFAEALVKYELLVHPNILSNTITVKQICGNTTRPLTLDKKSADDDVNSLSSMSRSVRSTTLSPIHEQGYHPSTDHADEIDKKRVHTSCCNIM